jgi:hypothetical protein
VLKSSGDSRNPCLNLSLSSGVSVLSVVTVITYRNKCLILSYIHIS